MNNLSSVSSVVTYEIAPDNATHLLHAWIEHLSTRYPVIHTPRLKEIHARRERDLDLWEKSMLHLVYANAGRILESVSASKQR